jgi:SAM-dependent methyltransferase
MAEKDSSDISVDEIMRRIKAEVERRKGASPASGSVPAAPTPTLAGRTGAPGDPQRVEVIPFGSMDSYINSRWFLEVAGQGFKGWVKRQVFKGIRFYAWWQEHINRAFYEELTRQQSKITEIEKGVQETLQQKFGELVGELSARDQTLEEINLGLARLAENGEQRQRDLEELQARLLRQKSEAEASQKLLRDEWTGKLDALAGEEKEKDKILEDLNARLIALGKREEAHYRENLRKGSEAVQREESLRSRIEAEAGEIRGRLAEQHKGVEEIQRWLTNFTAEETNFRDQIRQSVLSSEKKVREEQAAQDQILRAEISGLKMEFGDSNHLLDPFYVAFEDRFRGTREEIKERMKTYLPYVRQAAIGTGESAVLDLGCGRGEWLELLREEGFSGKGVDSNRAMVELCKERSLEAVEGEALEYLRKLKGDSLVAVTGFHFAEHIHVNTLVAILDECLRVLKSRGLVVFETPNPENLFVGAYAFHIDPTHKNPLVPDSFNFLAQQRGFVETKILRLHKYSDFHPVGEKTDDFQNKWFYSETDFALIGYKP